MARTKIDLQARVVSLADEGIGTLAAGIATRLRTLIASGEVPPGEKLRLDELRAQFGVSLSPLREALSRLTAEGFVVAIEGQRGYRVAPISENNLVEVTRLRAEIEPFALRESIAHGDDRWEDEVVVSLHRLWRLERSVEARASRVDDWEQAHRSFHQRLLAGCNMPLLLNFCSTLHDLSDRYRRIFLENHPIDGDIAQEHRDICDAALERRSDDACRLLRDHIDRTGRRVLQSLTDKAVEANGR